MYFARKFMSRSWLVAFCLATACLDASGPRPRPGTEVPEPPPDEEAALLWFELVPRVITQGRPDSIELNVAVSGNVSSVAFQTRSGAAIPLRRVNASLYTTKIGPAALLFGYRSGDLHNLGGFIEIDAAGASESESVIVNVKDATVPTINVTGLGSGTQATDYVMNIRSDDLNPGSDVAGDILRTHYDHFGDDYTFVAVIEQVNSPRPPFFIGVRNEITGIGLQQFDRGPAFGSADRLEGIVQYPNDSDFDPALTTNIHELAHRWMNYSTHPALAGARPHWPLSSLAYGIAGWHDPIADTALSFPFTITRRPDGTHLLSATEAPRTFNDFELYLMGLLPADSVQTHFVFADQNQRSQVRSNGVLAGAVDSLRVTDQIARDGARVPSAGAAPREFRLATIVLSRNRILTRDELSFFHHMALRGEQRFALQYSNGSVRGTTLPFSIATSGRALLQTRLRVVAPQ